MADARALDDDLAAERALGIRVLLAAPIVDATRSPAEFRVLARNRGWLTEWFEFGFAEMSSYLAKHAAFDDFCDKHELD